MAPQCEVQRVDVLGADTLSDGGGGAPCAIFNADPAVGDNGWRVFGWSCHYPEEPPLRRLSVGAFGIGLLAGRGGRLEG